MSTLALHWYAWLSFTLAGTSGTTVRFGLPSEVKIKRKSRNITKPESAAGQVIGIKTILVALFVLGFTSILSQLIVIREFLNVFQGNELIIGLILCIWMLLTAAGSRLGQRIIHTGDHRKNLARGFLLSGILPAVIIVLLYVLETRIFPPGTTKGLVTAFIFCFCLLMPFCLISGMLFTMLACTFSGVTGANKVSEAYGWESAGSMTAGLLFSLLLVYLLRTFQVLAIIAGINLIVYILIHKGYHPAWTKYSTTGALIILTAFLFAGPVDHWVKSIHFKNQELVYSKDTPYGNVSVTFTAGQYNFYENGTFMFSTENQIMQEEAVHFALLQLERPEKVLIVSGGMTGMAKQALKYPTLRSIDYYEINPWLVKAEKRFSDTLFPPMLKVINRDARRGISKSSQRYDGIIINTPDPSNAQINRYYTLGFFEEAKQALRPNGVFLISLSPTVNYMSADAREINRIVYHTLKKVFKQVEVIPGERNYFIASDTNLRIDIAQGIQARGIENDFVNPGYIDDELLSQYSHQILDEISAGPARINQDLAPLAYFRQISYWLSTFQENGLVIILLILILMLLVLRRMSPVAAGVFTGGFAGASSSFIVLISFQILYGYVYQMLGIIIAFYMTGLSAGAIIGPGLKRKVSIRSYIWIQLIFMGLIVLLPLIINWVSRHNNIPEWTGQAFLFITTAAIAFIAGFEFNMASRLEPQRIEKIAGNLYGIDLAGAACGTFMVSLILFPLLGLLYTCLLIALLILASIILMFVFRKKYTW